jgi:tryptophan halogenase
MTEHNTQASSGPGLNDLLATMEPDDATRVRGWLGDSEGLNIRRFSASSERTADTLPRPRVDDPQAIRRVGVLGGGTAGYLTALALRAKRPWLEVTLVETPTVPIIGVGESTTPSMVTFLHHYLGIDPAELYRRVGPTWKQGIRFDWGPDPDGFVAPFDWDTNSIGMRGSIAAQGDINAASLQALLMKADRTPVFDLGEGRHLSLMKYLPFAYHLDNARFVTYLTELALERGVQHLNARIAEVVRSADDWVDHLRMTDGQQLSFDMYVDCTGFPSVLLGKGLATPYQSFSSSLFTDSAVTGNVDHGGHLRPYTTAITMDAGWCWNIPTRESNHLGYVYSSAMMSDDAAAQELARRFPGVSEPRQVRFRVGRHEQIWRGNVMGVGNSYAFVEPLESSGLLMITWAILALVSTLPASWADPRPHALVNAALAGRWDAVRWFLAVHYRFNTRLDTPFWKEARERTDVAGMQPLLDVYAAGAPLRFRDKVTLAFAQSSAPTFYGIAGIDTILMGQKVPARLVAPAEPLEHWRRRKAGADALVRRALPQADALAAFENVPRLQQELLGDADSWARPGVALG